MDMSSRKRTIRVAAVAAVTACVLMGGFGSPAGSQTTGPRLDGLFPVPGGIGTNNQIAAGPDGNMWVTLSGGGTDVARLTAAGVVTEFDLPGVAGPVGVTSAAGQVWLTQANGVVRFDPADPTGSVVVTTIPAITDPRGIVVGPDDNLWTASESKVVKIPPANPAGFTPFAGTGLVSARAITATPTTLWIADFGGNQIVQVDLQGDGSTFPVGSGPQGIAANTDGQVGFSLPGATPQAIGRALPVVTTPVGAADPFGVISANDRAWWVAEFAGNRLGRLTRKGVLTYPITFPLGSGPRQLAQGPDDTVWVTLDTVDQVAKVVGVEEPPQTVITAYPKPTVRTHKPRARLRYHFIATPPTASFQCRMKHRGSPMPDWRRCSSPVTYRRPPGRYRFMVRAVTSIPDASKAQHEVRVVHRR